jgi:hypothetical protein
VRACACVRVQSIMYVFVRDGWSMWHVWDRGDIRRGFWWGNVREREHLRDTSVDGSIVLK